MVAPNTLEQYENLRVDFVNATAGRLYDGSTVTMVSNRVDIIVRVSTVSLPICAYLRCDGFKTLSGRSE